MSSARPHESLAQDLIRSHPDETAHLLEAENDRDIQRLVLKQPAQQAADLLRYLSPLTAAQVLDGADVSSVQRIFHAMDPAEIARLLSHGSPDFRERYIEPLEPALKNEVRALLNYPRDSAGYLMDTRVMAFRSDAAVRDVLMRLRAIRRRRIDTLFLVDTDQRLQGAVPLQELILASPSQSLAELQRAEKAVVLATATREDVVETFHQTQAPTLPVVDLDNRLLGVLRYDALTAAAQEESTADLQTMVGVSKEERVFSPPLFAVRKRLPWLNINLATAFLAAAVVGVFESTIAKITALAVLLPVVAGQSGNTGAQALAVTMRGLALREIRPRHWWRITLKEAGVGTLNGIAIALVTSLGVYVWSRSAGLSFVIGAAMVVSMAVAGLAGAAIPLMLAHWGQDPAQSSSIILTTITDVVGFFSFLGLATVFISFL